MTDGAESAQRNGECASNVERVRRAFEHAGLFQADARRLSVGSFEDGGEPGVVAVSVTLHGHALRLLLEPRDDARPAFARTRSFNVGYEKREEKAPLAQRALAALEAIAQRLARFDPGDITLLRNPPPARRALPVAPTDAVTEEPERAFSRVLFDEAFDRLVESGVQSNEIVIVVAQACEMRCQFCPTADRVNIHLRPHGEAGQLEDLLHQLRRGREIGATEVDFGGNDVLRFPDVLRLFETAGGLGYQRIVAQSPGQILADRRFAEAVANSPLTEVCIPIYGSSAEVHDRIVGKPGAFDQLVSALGNASTLGRPRVALHTIALASTAELLEDLIAFCERRFGLALRVTPLRSNRQGEREVVQDIASYRTLQPIIDRHAALFRAEAPICRLPAAIRPAFGDVRSRFRTPLNLYDLGLPVGSEDAQVASERARLYPSKCERCSYRLACPGVLGNYLARFGDEELSAIE